MRLLLMLTICLASTSTALALDTTTRAVGPIVSWTEGSLERFDPAWVHVKFVEGTAVDLIGDRFVQDGTEMSVVNRALRGALQVRRTFPGDRETFREWKHRGELASGRTGPDLSLWYDVEIAGGRGDLANLLGALNALPEVEIAHPAPICETAALWGNGSDVVTRAEPSLRGGTPDYSAQQGYLYETPVGLDAPSAWAEPGGRGAGIKFLDVELGWTHTHEDFDASGQFYEGGVSDPTYVDHGTAVLGEVIGTDNGIGVTGFANEASWGTVAITVGEWPDVPHYFQEAVDNLDPGDVWLIELQMYPPGRDATPMEWLQVNYDVIWTSTWALGIVCVEAGANGGQNLDDPSWDGVFDRDVRDSGAILVGAGTPNGRVAEWFTNYGDRMDVHAWGSQIVTTGYGDLQGGASRDTWYTAVFGGTSGASPMITGSALCIQGIAKATLGDPLTPSELRQLLAETGIPHLDASKEIGPRPDLAAAVEGLVDPASAPEVADDAGVGGTHGTRLTAQSPFSRDTEIHFRQEEEGRSRIEIHDVRGRLVRTLRTDRQEAGTRVVRWDGRDAQGLEVGSGVYWIRIVTGSEVLSGRAVKIG